jgi:hypothetical protein
MIFANNSVLFNYINFLFSLLTLVAIAFSSSVVNAQINNNEFKVNLRIVFSILKFD